MTTFWFAVIRPAAATTRVLPVRSALHENRRDGFCLLKTMAYLLRTQTRLIPPKCCCFAEELITFAEELITMDSESAFRANIASLASSLKNSRTEDQPEEDLAEVDLAEPLATESNSDSDDGRPEAEETQATVGNEPLSIHLNEIRSFQLLTHQQEIDIAKLREDGESKNLESILSTPVAFRHVLDLADKVQNNEIRLTLSRS